jgi:hypothetical protein
VSFLVVSAAAALVVSALVVSALVVSAAILEESALVESAPEAEEEPLQAAKETAIAKAKKPNLKFFMFNFLISDLIVYTLIPETKKGNP